MKKRGWKSVITPISIWGESKTTKNYPQKMRKIFIIMAIVAIGVSMTSCKAWRTITTTQTYVTQDGDKTSTVTFTTKQVEDYQGKKK